MTKIYFTNCQIVLPTQTVANGSLVVDGQTIAQVCPAGITGHFREINLHGATLMPGMIDLHCDAIETLAEPRSGIFLPFDLAVHQVDQLAAINGITTFYCAVSFAGEELGLRNQDAPARLVRTIRDYRGRAKSDLKIHLRFEVTVEEALADILQFLEEGTCDLVSYMDHSPGQGQFQDEANYRSYVSARYGYSDDAITEMLEAKMSVTTERGVIQSRTQQLAAVAARCRVPLAGHDADSPAHVEEMLALGASLAEFPMSMAAAQAAARAGLRQSVGAVNVIRGGSQRTGMSAQQLISAGLADCLCSDYVPATLLPAVLKLHTELKRPLHEIVSTVTLAPAQAMGLDDRGQIAEGKRADLVAFDLPTTQFAYPLVRLTCRSGQLIYWHQHGRLTLTTAHP